MDKDLKADQKEAGADKDWEGKWAANKYVALVKVPFEEDYDFIFDSNYNNLIDRLDKILDKRIHSNQRTYIYRMISMVPGVGGKRNGRFEQRKRERMTDPEYRAAYNDADAEIRAERAARCWFPDGEESHSGGVKYRAYKHGYKDALVADV